MGISSSLHTFPTATQSAEHYSFVCTKYYQHTLIVACLIPI